MGAVVAIWLTHKRALFLLLLSLSTGTKLFVGAPGTTDEQAAAKVAISIFLNRYGFLVNDVDDQTKSPFVTAYKGECRFLLAAVAPQGWDRDIIHRLGAPNDRVFFVVDGEVYEDQPRWRTWIQFYLRRLNRYIGRRLAVRPTLGAIASPECDVRHLAWQDFPKLP
jgi:hypothetical protein